MASDSLSMLTYLLIEIENVGMYLLHIFAIQITQYPNHKLRITETNLACLNRKMEIYFNFHTILTIILSFCISEAISQNTGENRYFVEPNLPLGNTWEGWGTSLAWWADMLGGMDDSVVDHVTDAFFNVIINLKF